MVRHCSRCKGHGFESHLSNMPVFFSHRARESTEYTVLTHIGVWIKPKRIFFIPNENFHLLNPKKPYNFFTFHHLSQQPFSSKKSWFIIENENFKLSSVKTSLNLSATHLDARLSIRSPMSFLFHIQVLIHLSPCWFHHTEDWQPSPFKVKLSH